MIDLFVITVALGLTLLLFIIDMIIRFLVWIMGKVSMFIDEREKEKHRPIRWF